ncbi:hypothetical protein A2U01_0066670 [Trifolium medium]|uniref:Uncharacterized protein n=1 Tax=Trifolium medium TaxID=97028 RepID=A0A392S969_9FABA|nr:hypothetical protein [Trifolium medium]
MACAVTETTARRCWREQSGYRRGQWRPAQTVKAGATERAAMVGGAQGDACTAAQGRSSGGLG